MPYITFKYVRTKIIKIMEEVFFFKKKIIDGTDCKKD